MLKFEVDSIWVRNFNVLLCIVKFMLENWFVLFNRRIENFLFLNWTALCKEERTILHNVFIIILNTGLTKKGHEIRRANHMGNSGVGKRTALIEGNTADSTVNLIKGDTSIWTKFTIGSVIFSIYSASSRVVTRNSLRISGPMRVLASIKRTVGPPYCVTFLKRARNCCRCSKSPLSFSKVPSVLFPAEICKRVETF